MSDGSINFYVKRDGEDLNANFVADPDKIGEAIRDEIREAVINHFNTHRPEQIAHDFKVNLKDYGLFINFGGENISDFSIPHLEVQIAGARYVISFSEPDIYGNNSNNNNNINNNINNNTNINNELLDAAQNGLIAEVERLLAAGANKDATNNELKTPLMLAAENGHAVVVERLLAAGADKEAKDDYQNTALIHAAIEGHAVVVELLLAAGAAKEAKNGGRNTALLLAALNGRAVVVERLLAAGADKEAKDAYQNTALIDAAIRGHTAVVELLLAAGADITKKNNHGKTALDYAKEQGYREIIALIKAKEPKWRGWSRLDVEKFNLVLDTTPAAAGERPPSENWSVCPVCLAYSERSEGCMYMKHKCTSTPYYHKQLYDMFKSADGYIDWCTICGRICKAIRTHRGNEHRHYNLSHMSSLVHRMPDVFEPTVDPIGLFFGGDGECRQSGGGGYDEKLARMRRMREYALRELNPSADKTYEDAWNELVEETWNAPFVRSERAIKGIKEHKEWNIPHTSFPEPPAEAAPVANGPIAPLEARQYYPFAGRPAVMPIVHAEGGENVNIGVEYPILFQMRHRQANGEIKTHAKKSSLDSILMALRKVVGVEDFGTCIIEGEHACNGIIYPGELQYMLNTAKANGLSDEEARPHQETIDTYKSRFAEHFRSPGGAAFRDRIAANIAAADGMAVGGAGQGGGRRRRSIRRRKLNRRKTHRR